MPEAHRARRRVEVVLRVLTWLVARLLLLSVCILLLVTFNFTVFALHLVLLFLWAVSMVGIFVPERQPAPAPALVVREPLREIVPIPVEVD